MCVCVCVNLEKAPVISEVWFIEAQFAQRALSVRQVLNRAVSSRELDPVYMYEVVLLW